MWSKLGLSIYDEEFSETLKKVLEHLEMTIKDFSRESGIPLGTLYKISSKGGTDCNVQTLIRIVNAFRRLEGFEEGKKVIGVISTRQTLDTLRDLSYEDVKLIRYPATTIEEEIIRGIDAERDGVEGLICGPIASTTLCKVVKVPIMSIPFETSALETAINRLSKQLQ